MASESNRFSKNSNDTRPKKKYTYYQQKYIPGWEKEPQFYGWLSKSDKGIHYFYCNCCHFTGKCGKSEILKHASSKKHITNSKGCKKQKTLPDMSSSLIRKAKIDTSVKLCAFIAKHNLPLSVMDHLPRLIASVCPDSEIGKQIKSGRLQAPTVAVVLSGTGVYDGSEIHEATAAMSSITRAGADIQCYAPDEPQMQVIDHVKGAPIENVSRNVLIESARIARGNIKPLSELNCQVADAVIFPGGFGAAKNLSDFAVNGAKMTLKPDVERVLKDFHSAKKPIGLCCIAPMLAAKAFGPNGVQITLGKKDDGSGKWPYADSIEAAVSLGAVHVEKGVDEVVIDEVNKVVSTPAFMYDGKFHEIYDGVAKMVNAVVKMIPS